MAPWDLASFRSDYVEIKLNVMPIGEIADTVDGKAVKYERFVIRDPRYNLVDGKTLVLIWTQGDDTPKGEIDGKQVLINGFSFELTAGVPGPTRSTISVLVRRRQR